MISRYELKKFYDGLPGDVYFKALHSRFFLRRKWHKDRIETVLKHMPAGRKTVLDVGCGSGIISFELAKEGHDVIGIDLGRKFAKWSADYAREKGLKVMFAVADAESLPFPDDQFDVVVCAEVIEHVPNPERAIKEIYRVLEPNGILILSTPYESRFWKVAYPLWTIIRGAKLEALHRRFSLHEIGGLLQKASFWIEAIGFIFFKFSMYLIAKTVKEETLKGLRAESLSIIVPAYNEEKRIGYCLQRLTDFFRLAKQAEYEIIVVNDGSTDRTADIIRKWQSINRRIRLVNNPRNLGKGGALRRGFREAKGDIVIFLDADCSTDPVEIVRLIDRLRDADIVVGSRATSRSILLLPPPKVRQIAGIVFNRITNFLFKIGVRDFLCGFKIFRRKVIQKILPELRTNGWEIDVDMLARAKRYGFRIREEPIVWTYRSGSKIRLLRHSLAIAKGLIRLKKALSKEH